MIEALLQAERLLTVGMLDEAEQIYRRVAEQDPRNSIAFVGLARVAVERREDEAALAHARAALEIDSQNAAALRLQARLTEILAARQQQAAPAGDAAPASTRQAPWESTAPVPTTPAPEEPEEPAEPAPSRDARPSERTVFARNPSMADHRRMEHAGQPEPADLPRPSHAGQPPGTAVPKRRSLLDRLLGRRQRGS